MVLKRLFFTALGALGLGALAAGSAVAQEIPPPDLFDDQVTCTMNVPPLRGGGAVPTPTVKAPGAMASALEAQLGMSRAMITLVDDTGTTDAVEDALYQALIYVVPADGSNCGRGTAVVDGVAGMPFNAVTDDMGTPNDPSDDNKGEGPIATDVAAGYTKALQEFNDVYGTNGTAAEVKRLNDLIAEENKKASPSTTLLESYRTQLTEATNRDNKERAELNAVAKGPIYQAGIAEWMAKSAVEKAVTGYNKAVGEANTAKTALDGSEYNAKYVPLGNHRLVDRTTDGATSTGLVTVNARGVGTVDLTELEEYTNINGGGMTATSTITDGVLVSTTTTESNFDDRGRLVVPMDDHDSDATTAARRTTLASSTVAAVRRARDRTEIALKALQKLQRENTNTGLQPAINVAVSRAQQELNHYNAEFNKMLADNTDLVTDVDGDADTIGEQSIRTRQAAYLAKEAVRTGAANTLRTAAADREAKTKAVIDAFTSPADFYQTLVDRREYLKAQADAAVARAMENGGTASKDLTDEAGDAQEALEVAQQAQKDYLALVEDENDPTVDLISELLKSNGDDGKALVDAISGTYDTAKDAKDTADRVAEDVMGLTGEGGDVAMNTAAIAENADNITALDGRVAMNEAEIWDADGNSRIDMNETRSMENRTMIGENRGMIMRNAENIMGLRTDVDSNTGRITQNEMDIMTNAGNIMTNSGRITANEGNISSNADAIAANMNSIGQNASAIGDNRNMIGELSDSLEVVRAGVAASMALAGMPAINGRGVSIGIGSYDGESAFAVGFQIQGEMASFKVGVTSSGGETGASAGVGFQF